MAGGAGVWNMTRSEVARPQAPIDASIHAEDAVASDGNRATVGAGLDATFSDRGDKGQTAVMDDAGPDVRDAPITLATSESDASVASEAAPNAPADAAIESGSDREGIVELPRAAYGHRVFVDGKLVGDAMTTSLTLACGRHVVKIGSAGRDQEIDVPCGGRVPIAYP
jgi:hypothetical protein